MADPYQRGKLTPHGWRVAYHLARTMKSRKLELPETLPHCLYPPGYVPPVASSVEEKGDTKDVSETQQAGIDGTKGDEAAVDGAAVKKGDKAAHTAAAAAEGSGVTKNDANASKSVEKNKKKKKKVDGEETAAKKGSKRRLTTEKATAATAASPVSAPVNEQLDKNEPKDEAAEYRMNESQQARYDKMYDKLTKGNAGKTIGRKQVWYGSTMKTRPSVQRPVG